MRNPVTPTCGIYTIAATYEDFGLSNNILRLNSSGLDDALRIARRLAISFYICFCRFNLGTLRCLSTFCLYSFLFILPHLFAIVLQHIHRSLVLHVNSPLRTYQHDML